MYFSFYTPMFFVLLGFKPDLICNDAYITATLPTLVFAVPVLFGVIFTCFLVFLAP